MSDILDRVARLERELAELKVMVRNGAQYSYQHPLQQQQLHQQGLSQQNHHGINCLCGQCGSQLGSAQLQSQYNAWRPR